ncbi:MAG: hypothetical protein AB4368_14765 [Xenococcaceae cyanobacterium]
MTITTSTKIGTIRSEKILATLDPSSDRFNFEVWSSEVRKQMLTALQKQSNSSRRTKL